MATKRTILLLLFSCNFAFLGCRYDKQDPPKDRNIQIGIATWPGFAPGFIAKERQFFEDLNVDLLIMDDFSVRQNSYTSGKTLATISTLDSFAFESGQGVFGKVVLVLDESFGADGIVVNKSINLASDLKGKKIAYTRGSPSHFFLLSYLKANGLSKDDIQSFEVDDPGRAGEAFVSGSVDAAVTWEPNISRIVQSGQGRVLADTKTTPGLIVDVLVVSPRLLEEEAQVQELVNGWLKAVDYIKSNQSESYKIMATNLKIPNQEFPAMAAGLRYADLKRNKEILLPPGKSPALRIFDDAVAVWRSLGLISKPRRSTNAITSRFIENARF